MSHTPGPWFRDGKTVYALEHAGYKKGHEMHRNRFSLRVTSDYEQESEANTRLIAAAPELLDALREFMDIWGSVDAEGDSKRAQRRRAEMWTKANAAIAKAEGR